MTDFTIKDSGARQEFAGGMVRDVEDDKLDYTSCLYGPMFTRWMSHTTKGRAKYPDRADGTPNWTLGAGDVSVLARARRSAFRHFIAYMNGETDEDHAAGVFFNLNLAEFIKDSLAVEDPLDAEFAKTGANPDLFPTEVKQAIVEAQAKPRITLPKYGSAGGFAAQESRDRLARMRNLITD